jgi:enterochelin esterase-like enzyme
MSVAEKATRTQVWLETLGEWSWPGRSVVAVEALPPSWVPAFPPHLEPAGAAAGGSSASWQPERARMLGIGALLSALAAVCVALALHGQLGLEHLSQIWGARAPAQAAPVSSSSSPAAVLPTLSPLSQDAAGSSIDTASYPSAALHRSGSFLVYLPVGYAATVSHYPVLYLLTGHNQSANAFLQVGLQSELDRLIAERAIPPLIAVMIQGGSGTNNWRNEGALRYEGYVLEAQQLIDRMLPTIPARDARAIAGDSMGGYGSMNLALANPYRFGVVESWLGFFNGLDGELRADRPILKRLGLRAFVYGGESDHIADPTEDRPFAAALRRAGADAHGAVYPGGHSLETIEAHLASMLVFAGRSLREMQRGAVYRSPPA